MDMKAFAYDASGCGVLRVAGGDARGFLRTMYSGNLDACNDVGSATQGLFLNGQGEVVELATVLQTGDAEFLVLSGPDNAGELSEWLQAHAELSDDAGPVFPDLSVEDHADELGVLVLFGPGAPGLDAKLAHAAAGHLFYLGHRFDERSWGLPEPPSFVYVAPLASAPEVGEFLGAGGDLEALTAEEYAACLDTAGTRCAALSGAAYVKPAEAGLEALLRPGCDFVGARALGRMPEG